MSANPYVMSMFLKEIVTETRDILNTYLQNHYAYTLENPQYYAVSTIIQNIHDKQYPLLSNLMDDLNRLIIDPSHPDYDPNDLLLELIQDAKEMQRKKISRNSSWLFLYIDERNLSGLAQVLDAMSTLPVSDQIKILSAIQGRNSKNILFYTLDQVKRNQQHDLASVFDSLLTFITNLVVSGSKPGQGSLTASSSITVERLIAPPEFQRLIASLLTNIDTASTTHNWTTSHNLLICTLLSQKQFLPRLLALCELLEPDFSAVYWEYQLQSALFANLATHQLRSVLSYAITDAPEMIPLLLRTISSLGLQDQILIVHCALFNSYTQTRQLPIHYSATYIIPESTTIKINDHTVYNQAFKRFLELLPLLDLPVWTGVLLHAFPDDHESLFHYAVGHSSDTFFAIMRCIETLSPAEKARLLAEPRAGMKESLLYHTIQFEAHMRFHKELELAPDLDMVKAVLDAQTVLSEPAKSRIYSYAPSYSGRNVLMEAGGNKSPHMPVIRHEIDALPPEVISRILKQIDVGGVNVLMSGVRWDIESFNWYLAHVLRMSREEQVAILTHSDEEGACYEEPVKGIGENALLWAIRYNDPDILTALFGFINQVIYQDKEQTMLDLDILMTILKQTDCQGFNALTTSLFQQESPNHSIQPVLKLLQLVFENQSVLDKSQHGALPLFDQVNKKGQNILMLTLQHNKNAVAFILNYISEFPDAIRLPLLTRLLTSTNEEGYNALMLAIEKSPAAVPLLLTAIKLLDIKAQADIFKQTTTKGRNPLLLAVKANNGPDETDIAQSIHEAVGLLDNLMPGLLAEVQGQTSHKRYMRYFFQVQPRETEIVSLASTSGVSP